MKAKKVLDILGVTRKTLNTYVKAGKIRATRLGNGFYEYDDDDVQRLAESSVSGRRIVVFEPGRITEITPDFEGYEELVRQVLDATRSVSPPRNGRSA